MDIASNQTPAGKRKKIRPRRDTPEVLAAKGWNCRAASQELGCDIGHLHRVVTGKRISATLMRRVELLPNLTAVHFGRRRIS